MYNHTDVPITRIHDRGHIIIHLYRHGAIGFVSSLQYNRCRADRDLVTGRKDVNQTTAAKRDLLIWCP